MSDHGQSSMIEQALENLVNQFARPMDCLRELVQNSLDAGTPRIEVAVDYTPETPDHGVLTVHVDDFGEGMNEDIIDNQLTRMFSSTKEGDLTRIGKFGIGFTSIFAMRPDAVLLHTGRHGEYWELLFHPDRSYDKVRVDRPVSGTRITIYRRARRTEIARVVQEAREVLRYWCEHSSCPILFEDRTSRTEAKTTVDPDDPFAAFEAPPEPEKERISGPMALHGALLSEVERTEELEIHVGIGGTPTYGFYNGGLTLVSGDRPDLLGPFASQLRHLSFKVRADRLDHTLTRDSVLQNESWKRVMREILRVADRLSRRVLQEAERACASNEDLAPWHRVLLGIARAYPDRSSAMQGLLRSRPLFRGHSGPISAHALEQQERRAGGILLHPGDGPLAEAVHEAGWVQLRCTGPSEAVILAMPRPPLQTFLQLPDRVAVRAQDRFVLPTVVPEQSLPPAEIELLKQVRENLRRASRRACPVEFGHLQGQEQHDEFLVEAPKTGGLYERGGGGLWTQLWRGFSTPRLLLNREHHQVRTAIALAWTNPQSAALALTYAILIAEGRNEHASYKRLFARPEASA